MLEIKGMNPRASSELNLNFDLPRRKQRGIKKYNKEDSFSLRFDRKFAKDFDLCTINCREIQ